ncbi:4615_t:CDS:2, partial [Dentiscutata erythropus]
LELIIDGLSNRSKNLTKNYIRSGQSGSAYALGLFSGYGSLSDSKLQPVYIYSVPRSQDTELLMHHACPLWLDTVKESNFTRKQQEEKYLNSFISTISRRISDRLKIQPSLDPIHVDYIYRACSFAVSFSNKYDTWCSLLEKDDFLQLEYLLDLGYYYSYSYGYQLNTKLACRFFTSFVESVESYLTGRSQVKSTLKFAHAETIMFLATMLGLYEDNYPLTADTSPQQISSRKFRTSELAPFTANIYFEIYNCSTRYDTDPTFGTTLIQLMVNEKPTVIPKCIHIYCPWNIFKQILSDAINCDFDNMCKLTYPKFSLSIQHNIYF